MRNTTLVAATLAVLLSACSHETSNSLPSPAGGGAVAAAGGGTAIEARARGKIDHVIIVIQENRTFDNLFNGYPGADSVTFGYDHTGHQVPLAPVSFAEPEDPSHERSSLLTEYDGGKMDGFDLDPVSSTVFGGTIAPKNFVYAYVPRSETTVYWKLAQNFALADRMFSSQMAPSFPGHQYLIAGQSGRVISNPANSTNPQVNFVWGCDSPSGSTINVLNAQGSEVNGGPPCLDYQTLGDLLDARNVSWKYYSGLTNGFDLDGQVSAYDAIRHIRYGLNWTSHVPQNAVTREYQIFADLGNGQLPSVAWLTPPALASDHAGTMTTWGPDWIASVVNAVQSSRYASTTAILLTWDDSGGWYDHVRPSSFNGLSYGFRVPLIVISPWAKTGYVSHVQHDYGSILHFIESTFHLGSLGTVDSRADDLSDMFNFSVRRETQNLRLPVLHSLEQIRRTPTTRPVDDDR